VIKVCELADERALSNAWPADNGDTHARILRVVQVNHNCRMRLDSGPGADQIYRQPLARWGLLWAGLQTRLPIQAE
jgi:hypothetical protein